jgi:hypothetical protein
MGRATENLAETMGPGIGGLLNATFGNAAELIIALIALSRGPEMYPLVKASPDRLYYRQYPSGSGAVHSPGRSAP